MQVPNVTHPLCSVGRMCDMNNRVVHIMVFMGGGRQTKLSFAHVVPLKGGDIKWVSELVVRDLRKSVRFAGCDLVHVRA